MKRMEQGHAVKPLRGALEKASLRGGFSEMGRSQPGRAMLSTKAMRLQHAQGASIKRRPEWLEHKKEVNL